MRRCAVPQTGQKLAFTSAKGHTNGCDGDSLESYYIRHADCYVRNDRAGTVYTDTRRKHRKIFTLVLNMSTIIFIETDHRSSSSAVIIILFILLVGWQWLAGWARQCAIIFLYGPMAITNRADTHTRYMQEKKRGILE